MESRNVSGHGFSCLGLRSVSTLVYLVLAVSRIPSFHISRLGARFVHTVCSALRCGALRRLAVCGKNDATCRTMYERTFSLPHGTVAETKRKKELQLQTRKKSSLEVAPTALAQRTRQTVKTRHIVTCFRKIHHVL